MSRKLGTFLMLFLALSRRLQLTTGEAIALNPRNLSNVTYGNELVLILFYTEACIYSMNFMPIFDATAAQLRLFFGDTGKVALAKVDCGAYPNLGHRFDVGKYPSVKIVRFGRLSKREYRGQRSQDALIEFTHKELQDPIEQFHSMSDLEKLEKQKYLVLGYFESTNHLEYEVFRKTALALRDQYCHFHVSFGEAAMSLMPSGRNTIVFRRHSALTNSPLYSEYKGSMSSFSEVRNWTLEKCQPIVRVVTFDNAEEISEEGRPWVILFHHKNDINSTIEFEKVVQIELMDQLDKINFVTANLPIFDALFDIDKTEAELPLIVIDSIVHMYEFPKFEDIRTPGKLKEFIQKFYTGQLHISLHREEEKDEDIVELVNDTQIHDFRNLSMIEEDAATVPQRHKSKMKDLLPSRKRYTFIKDEL